MYKIKVITIGKHKEPWLILALEEYQKRLSSSAEITWILAKNENLLNSYIEAEKGYICLDSKGKSFTSEQFSKKILSFGAHITFVIGGDTGLSQDILSKASLVLSLSLLTFTHQMTRIILLEQIYRALEIEKGSPYHK